MSTAAAVRGRLGSPFHEWAERSGKGPVAVPGEGPSGTGRRHPEGGHPAVLRPPPAPWSRNDALAVIAVAALDLLAYTASSRLDGPALSLPAALTLVLSAVPLVLRRRFPVGVLLAVLVIVLVLHLTATMEHGFGAATVVALYTVARSRPPARVALLAGVTVLSKLPEPWSGSYPWTILGDVLATVAVCAAGLGMAEWHRQLEINRELLADRAVADERRRIARELHDIVAHHLTTMHLMSGGARIQLDRDPEAARAALVTLEASGRMALREMRQLLGVLRSAEDPEEAPSEPQPGLGDVERLIADSCLAGLPTGLTVVGAERPVPPAVGLTAYRIVQEALTNSRKHAGAARAHVTLAYPPERLTIVVEDDGVGDEGAPAGPAARSVHAGRPGYGLLGMRERVAVHGGSLETGTRPEGGYRVAAVLPLPASDGEQDTSR